jgi:hypothetical protein
MFFNYMIDLEWMISECPNISRIPLVQVVHGEKGPRAATISSFAQSQPNIQTFSAENLLTVPFGCHHSKCIILFYEDKLRLVICTLNFIEIDWRRKNQLIWLQDFPMKPGWHIMFSSPLGSGLNAAPAAPAPNAPSQPKLRLPVVRFKKYPATVIRVRFLVMYLNLNRILHVIIGL